MIYIDKKDELRNCNVVRTLMILLVVLYHSIALWRPNGWLGQMPAIKSNFLGYIAMWLNTFHIYTLTFISGYVFCYLFEESQKYCSFAKDIRKRFKRLIIPYIFVAVFWCIPFQIIFFKSNIKDILEKYILAITPSQLWYLIMMFGVFIIFYYLIENTRIREKNTLYIFTLLLILNIICGILNSLLPNILQIFTIGQHLVFYYLGYKARTINLTKIYNLRWKYLFIVNIIMYIIYINIFTNKLLIFKIISRCLFPFLNISGILNSFIGVNLFINKFGIQIFNLKTYKMLSEKSFNVYLFHQQIIFCIILIFNKRMSPIILISMNFIFSIFIAIMISIIILKLIYSIMNMINEGLFLIGR